jgi:cyclopropane fatty-acyl-phospholipid synthase-like methyltransferase
MTLIIPKRIKRDLVAEYTRFALEATEDLHSLTGRFSDRDATQRAIQSILDRVDFRSTDRVLDIGCGDASLLKSIPSLCRVGTVLTTHELGRLQAATDLKGIDFYAASFDGISAIPGTYDIIIVNGCFHFTRTEHKATKTLKSIANLLAPGGRLWLGELLSIDHRRHVFSSKKYAIKYVYKTYGAKFTLAFVRHIARHYRRADRILVLPPKLWHTNPDALASLAAQFDLHVQNVWNCYDITGNASYLTQGRFSVLLTKS